MCKVIVVGGGAAGMLAGIAATKQGAKVIVFEKMPNIGRKLLITGKGRCNITNACTTQELIKQLPGNGRFLYGAFSQFSNHDMVELLESHGLKTKVERGGRVFPVSDRAMDVVDKLREIFNIAGGKILTKKTSAGDFSTRW
jgi:Predicted flavoproteins